MFCFIFTPAYADSMETVIIREVIIWTTINGVGADTVFPHIVAAATILF